MIQIEAEVQICNELGLHLRAAAAFAKLADGYKSHITLSRDGMSASGKSIIALVTLAAAKGTTVCIFAEGEDAREAVSALTALVEQRFGEEA